MGSPKKRDAKHKEKQQSQAQRAKTRQQLFMDGIDSYVSEFEKLVADPPINGLFGIHQLDRDVITALSTDELLEHVGLKGHKHVIWNSEIGNEGVRPDDAGVKGSGFTCATMSATGRIVPVVFVQRDVYLDEDAGEHKESVHGVIRLVILLHELGHADDIIRGVNFNHERKTIDLIEAEAYAHQFVLTFAKKRNYRIALKFYLENIAKDLSNPDADESVKLSAKRVSELCDLDALKAFASEKWSDGGWQKDIANQRLYQRHLDELRNSSPE